MLKKFLFSLLFAFTVSFGAINYKVVPNETVNLDPLSVNGTGTFKDTVMLVDTVTNDSTFVVYNLNFTYTKPTPPPPDTVVVTVTDTVIVRDTVSVPYPVIVKEVQVDTVFQTDPKYGDWIDLPNYGHVQVIKTSRGNYVILDVFGVPVNIFKQDPVQTP